MNKYKIEITRYLENKNFDEQAKIWNEKHKYHYNNSDSAPPEPFYQEKALSVELTEEEFKEIKKAVMGVM